MEQNFDSGPSFGAMAQNGPKLKKLTPPTVFKLGISFLQNIINLPWPKNSWTKILIRAPVFGLWPKRSRNGPKLENRTTPSVFELQFSNAQIVLTLPCTKNCWTKILIQVPVLGLGGAQKWPKFHFFVFDRRGFKFSVGVHICYMK